MTFPYNPVAPWQRAFIAARDPMTARNALGISNGGGGVSSINTLTGALTIAAGTGINVSNAGTTITIASTGNQTITLSGDVTGSGATAIATTIANNAVTNAKLADIATARIRGRVTAGTGDPEDLTGTQATTLLDVFA